MKDQFLVSAKPSKRAFGGGLMTTLCPHNS